jgi:hypothetical protein
MFTLSDADGKSKETTALNDKGTKWAMLNEVLRFRFFVVQLPVVEKKLDWFAPRFRVDPRAGIVTMRTLVLFQP